MSKKIYVNGGICITTPFFKYAGGGAKYSVRPDGAEVIETNVTDENGSYLEISDDCPQSIFNEYYAATFFSTKYMCAEFFHKDYEGAYNDYLQRIADIKEVIIINGINEKQKKIIHRLSYISIIASMETFVCDTILTKITGDEGIFKIYYEKIAKKGGINSKELKKRYNDGLFAEWEQLIIESVITSSYGSIDKISTIYNGLFDFDIIDNESKMKNHFKNRNLFAHKNGRNKDGSYMEIDALELDNLIVDSMAFANQIMEKLKK